MKEHLEVRSMELILSLAFFFNLIMAALKSFNLWDPLPWQTIYWMLVVIMFITYGIGAGHDE